MNFYLDPKLLTLDKNSTSKDQLEEFIYSLLDYQKFLNLNWGRVFKPASTFDILFRHGLYPLVDNVKYLTRRYNIDYIQPEEIDKVINAILLKTMPYENHLLVRDLLYEDVKEDGTDSGEQHLNEFADTLKEMALSIALACDVNQTDVNKEVVISNQNLDPKIKLNVNVQLADTDLACDFPYNIEAELNTYSGFNVFLSKHTAADIWTSVVDQTCFIIAIGMQIKQTDNDFDFYRHFHSPSFLITQTFIVSQKELNFQNDKTKAQTLLRSLAEEILKKNMAATHELRINKGANSKQIEWNGYVAWRRDIDQEFHLHYWTKGGKVVFTDVVHHNKFKISKFYPN